MADTRTRTHFPALPQAQVSSTTQRSTLCDPVVFQGFFMTHLFETLTFRREAREEWK